LDAQLVGELAPFPEQFPGNRVHLAAFVFDEDPDPLVGFESFVEFDLASAGSSRC
jgi:hypothetical protein